MILYILSPFECPLAPYYFCLVSFRLFSSKKLSLLGSREFIFICYIIVISVFMSVYHFHFSHPTPHVLSFCLPCIVEYQLLLVKFCFHLSHISYFLRLLKSYYEYYVYIHYNNSSNR